MRGKAMSHSGQKHVRNAVDKHGMTATSVKHSGGMVTRGPPIIHNRIKFIAHKASRRARGGRLVSTLYLAALLTTTSLSAGSLPGASLTVAASRGPEAVFMHIIL
jgi:hypothetical protein